MTLRLGRFERVHRDAVERLLKERAVARVWAGDSTLWKPGEDHKKTIESALGWLTIPDRITATIEELQSFVAEVLPETDRVVVLGMGGSSLAPLVFASSFKRPGGFPELEVLDSTEPTMVLATAGRCDPARTLFIVSSKSGTTLEPNILFDYFFDLAEKALGEKAGERFVVVTDPRSALQTEASRRRVRRVFPGDPNIGGRYSALSNFGLVPAAFLGVDLPELLRRARDMADRCRRDAPANPGALLGAAMAALAMQGRDKLTFSVGRPVDRLGMWAEQLIAESTGKEEKGIVPVEGEALGSPEAYGEDRFFVRIETARGAGGAKEALDALSRAGHPIVSLEPTDAHDLGAEMFRWEFATAIAGALLAINPFDQPNVQEAKDRTNEILGEVVRAGQPPHPDLPAARFARRGLRPRPAQSEARGDPSRTPAEGEGEGVRQLLETLKAGDYFAITAYIPSTEENEQKLNRLRLLVRDAKKVATTVGFGPRFLHSTGQLHKGGADNGVFLQITAQPAESVPIPGKPYGFAEVVAAQAAGDLAALASRGRRALRVHLGKDVSSGLDGLSTAVSRALDKEKER